MTNGRWSPSSVPTISCDTAAPPRTSRCITTACVRRWPHTLSVDDTRDIHGLLVRTLTARGIDDPEALFEHYKGAGDRDGRGRAGGAGGDQGARRARVRSGRGLLSQRPRADAGRAGRRRVDAGIGGGADQCRPTAGGRARVSRGVDRRPRLAAGRSAASRRRTVPHRRPHRPGHGRHPHGPSRLAHAAGAEPAGGARLTVMAARADPPARTRVRGTRRGSHSGRQSAAHRYLLVRDHRSRDGRQHSCGGFQHPSSAAGARGR